MMFTWSFLAFYDIPGLGKYGFLGSVRNYNFAEKRTLPKES